ncbi:uncharacterized protein LOC118188627 [Stegodyphus dumicola]|uniref:uncharacterized protein LOC118188627 n=1 Tax=Stegodyphus dumicola TaxID=202533 RepID=UPI0015AC9130|nr:uncharacterized protein LOC118188627 [Stegodyphus dumicola]
MIPTAQRMDDTSNASEGALSMNNEQEPNSTTTEQAIRGPTQETSSAEANSNQAQIKCTQINLQRAVAATTQVVQHAIQYNLDFLIIQEPYCREGQVASLPLAWKIFQKKANAEQAPRAAIVCCNPSWSPYVVTTERDFVTILVIFEEQQFLLTSVYSPPTEGLTDVTCNFIRVKQKCPTVPHVVGGDFNAHNIIWGYQDTTPKGRDMEDFMACHDLHLHNSQGAQPTYDNTYHKGWPDLTLSTANFANNFSSWDVLDDESNSDHRYIHFTLTLEASINILQRFKLPGGKRYDD